MQAALLTSMVSRPPSGQEALREQFRASVSPVLLFVGAFYAVFSGTIFLNAKDDWAPLVWAATMALGITIAGAGWIVRRRELSDTALDGLLAALSLAVVAHIMIIIALAGEPSLSSYAAIILVGGGYFLIPRRLLIVLHAAAAIAWMVVLQSLHVPLSDAPSSFLVGGIAVGWGANALRHRHILARWNAQMAMAGTLEASEDRFRSLAETAKDGILLLDEQGRLTYVNPAGQRLFGLRPTDIQGRFLAQHLGPDASSPEAMLGTRECIVHRRDGTSFAAELSLARTEREGTVAYTGVLRDITERKRSEAASKESTAREAEFNRLREMNEFKTQFLNMAAHELNTPLTPLRLQLHLLKEEQMGALNERQTKAVALLDRNVTRLSGLVGELLEVARLQSGRLRMVVTPVAIDQVVDEVMDSFSEAARRVGVNLSYAGQQNLNVQADRNRVVQVLFNLVSNAIKFTPGGGSITVQASDHGTYVEISVADTGLGMNPDQLAKLFQPFTQVHDPMKVTVSGTGLGLYICKALLEAQGGSIQVKSSGPGQGSTFTFTLPTAEAQVARAAPVRAADEDPIVRRLRELI